jgi:hypothetical protein
LRETWVASGLGGHCLVWLSFGSAWWA